MARPEKNTVTYFPLDCETGKKMYYIEETYGNDGYASFIKILQELARSEYHYLNLSKNTTLMFLSAKCKVSKEILLSIIKDLVDLEKFDKELWDENNIIWCQDFIDSIQDAYLKRKNKCIDKKSLLLLLNSLGILKSNKLLLKHGLCSKIEYNNTQIKEENIKENKTIFNFKNKLLELIDNQILVNDYVQHRKTKKAPLTETFFNSLVKECQDNNFSLEQALTICIEKNWVGFKYQWVGNLNNQTNKDNGKSITTKEQYRYDPNRAIQAILGDSE